MGKIDWSGRNYESTYEVYPAGTYRVKVKNIEDTIAKSSSNPQFKVQGEITEGDYKGKPITQFMVNIDSCAWKIMQLVWACGVEVGKLPDMDNTGAAFKKIVHSIEGKESWWVVAVAKDRNGNDKNDTGSPHFTRIEGEETFDAVDDNEEVDAVPEWVKEK